MRIDVIDSTYPASVWRIRMARSVLLRTWVLFLFLMAGARVVIAQEPYVSSIETPGSFSIAKDANVCSIYVDSQDWPGVMRAVNDLKLDINRVTGQSPTIINDRTKIVNRAIIVGTIGKSPLLDDLAKAGKIDTRETVGKWESFFIQVVADPIPGVSSALVIAGSDKRGTIYGLYDLSEQMGVSPWYWWADVPVEHKNALFVQAGKHAQGEPSVRYRGIFLNDESPDLTNWVKEKFGTVPVSANPPIPAGVANYNSQFYARLFELMLRLKANYLWPAMWNNAFNEDDPANPKMADEYGIVMGTSHQEPMLRAQKEWDHRHRQSWNYYTDAQTLQDFWREGIRRNKSYESIITLGLRGANDSPMIPNGTTQQSMDLLKQIIAVQRNMIAEEINPDLSKVPQLWCPYKEVLDYYNAGLRVPDDVTLLWTDDNWGNLRRLPTPDERTRGGGAGIYYHFDYVGGPRNYKWINTNPIAKVREQMTLAKDYGADRIWIVNVGHFKGLELPIDYFLHLAWKTDDGTNQNVNDFTRRWAERQFGSAHATDIAEILSRYTKFNGRRKPELLDPNTYSLINYQEAETVAADYHALAAKAQDIYDHLPPDQRDAFYELVLFPVKACAQVNELYVAAGKNALYAQQGRASANDLAAQVQALFKADADLMDVYNHNLGGGKWNHFMDQAHIGYTSWQDPPRNVMPRVRQIEVPAAAALGVAVEGSTAAWPGGTGDATLPTFDSFNRQRHFIDVFNRGQAAFACTATASAPWIQLTNAHANVDKEARLWVDVDWSKAPKETTEGTIIVAREGGESVTVHVKAFNPSTVTPETLDGFVEADGYVSVEAEHFTRNVPAKDARWEKLDDYGRTLSAMAAVPGTSGSATPPKDSPCLEYKMYLFDKGDAHVLSVVAPTLNFVPGRGLRFALSFDEEPPQVITIVAAEANAQNGNAEWENSVKDNCRIVQSTHTLRDAGYHTLKIWMVDPAVVLEKIVVDMGGVKACYLGPPESFRHAASLQK